MAIRIKDQEFFGVYRRKKDGSKHSIFVGVPEGRKTSLYFYLQRGVPQFMAGNVLAHDWDYAEHTVSDTNAK